MKTPPSRRRSGFTLVELLVVIAIIAVLASAGFAAGAAAMNKAKKVTGDSVAQSIVSAVNSYYTENASMPVPQGASSGDDGTKFDTSKGDGIKVLEILTGLDDEINTRRVRYLTVKEGKGKKNGIEYNSTGKQITGLYDPFGNPYFIVLDTNYEERIKVKPGTTTVTLNGKRAAVYSAGQDKKGGTPDDIKTW
jgi:prepilin-type N-terminal cleavage/methylation domain-containing protein